MLRNQSTVLVLAVLAFACGRDVDVNRGPAPRPPDCTTTCGVAIYGVTDCKEAQKAETAIVAELSKVQGWSGACLKVADSRMEVFEPESEEEQRKLLRAADRVFLLPKRDFWADSFMDRALALVLDSPKAEEPLDCTAQTNDGWPCDPIYAQWRTRGIFDAILRSRVGAMAYMR